MAQGLSTPLRDNVDALVEIPSPKRGALPSRLAPCASALPLTAFTVTRTSAVLPHTTEPVRRAGQRSDDPRAAGNPADPAVLAQRVPPVMTRSSTACRGLGACVSHFRGSVTAIRAGACGVAVVKCGHHGVRSSLLHDRADSVPEQMVVSVLSDSGDRHRRVQQRPRTL